MINREEKLLKYLYGLSKHKNECIIRENIIDLNTYSNWKAKQEFKSKSDANHHKGKATVVDLENVLGTGVLILSLNNKRHKIEIQASRTALFKIGDVLNVTLKRYTTLNYSKIIELHGVKLIK